MTKNRTMTNAVEREDRLSSLHDEILLSVISCLPLELAILSGLLSRRWRNLWTNINSIYLSDRKFENNSEFVTTIDNIMMQITSPTIHTFTLEFYLSQGLRGLSTIRQSSINSWLSKICEKRVRELKVSYTSYLYFPFPSFVFQSQSLVSVELTSVFYSPLPDSINLPNLKRLFVSYPSLWDWNWFDNKLMKGCPLLEELSLKWLRTDFFDEDYIRLSHGNLKQFSIYHNYAGKCINIAISAPKLEYMDMFYFHSAIVLFEEEPNSLREIKSEMSSHHQCVVSRKENKITPKFQSVRRLTFLVRLLSNIENMLTLVRLCPALEVLILDFQCNNCVEWNLAKLSEASVLLRVKKIEIETCYLTYLKFPKSIRNLVETLLSKLVCLEEFHFRMNNKYRTEVDVKEELTLCKLLYKCPMISTTSEVHFKGKIVEMSRKLGPYAWKANGEVITFDLPLTS